MADHGAMLGCFFYDFLDLFRVADEGHPDDVDVFIELADGGFGHAFCRIAQGIRNHIDFRYFIQGLSLLIFCLFPVPGKGG